VPSASVSRPAAAVALRGEVASDAAAIERVCARAFGPGRFAKTSERVREIAELRRDCSMVAVEQDRVLGCCRIWSIRIAEEPAFFLGPLAVEPTRQHAGLGAALTEAALAACAPERRWIVLVGRPAFFAPFGFYSASGAALHLPGPLARERLLWRSPAPGAVPPSGEVSGLRAARPA